MILVVSLILGALMGTGSCQKGHYIRPFVESHYPVYGLPVYEEVPVVPRLYPGLFQTHPPPQFRSRKTNRASEEAIPQKIVGSGAGGSGTAVAAGTSPARQAESHEESRDSVYPILSYRNEMGNEGDYSYKFETADGQSKEETSVMTTSEDGKTARSVRGSYSYPTADGRTIRVDYVADEGGFRATTVTEGEGAAAPGVGASYRRLGERGFVYTYRAPS
ncbi:hypothetical protein GE061_012646 [Apolygus lucorum]|uniref:Uncharacterized protein n=1 Tax=Apolygus lucorum TaxID=248454 RepID=A0A6A4JJB8_APOLU|nr:hypothetical protein GE061_012646 [Apolygus lucorum]